MRTLSAAPPVVSPLITSGLLAKCATGSATAHVNIPTPIPALNIIENHENIENSGFSPSSPRLSRPAAGQSAKPMQTMIKRATAQMYQAAKLAKISVFQSPSVLPAWTGQKIAQTTSALTMILLATVTSTLNPL